MLKLNLSPLLCIALLLGSMIFFVGCDEDEMPPVTETKTVVDVALEGEQFTTLVAALQKAELVTTLQGEGPFTVFAPTNDAFAALLTDLGVSSLDDLSKEALTPILLYHVLGVKAESGGLTTGYVSTLSADSPNGDNVSLYINTDSGVVLNGDVNVTSADVAADNGVVHVIDKVLTPPTVVDIAVANGSFTSLVAAVVKAELAETLSGDGPFTVFAPTDAAFQALLNELNVTLNDLSKEDLIPILTYHVLGLNARSAGLSSGMVETLNPEGMLDIAVDGNTVTINGNVQVVLADIQGKNGVVHVIDKVLTVPEETNTVVDVALSDDNFSSLVAALQKAELVETLQGEGPFTVFAPTNEAFANLLSDLGVGSLDDLSKEALTPILLYHVLGVKAESGGLSTTYVSTLSTDSPNGDNVSLYINTDNGVVLNGDVTVTTADVAADNGVVHVIDKVLTPPNVVELAIENGGFGNLVAAVVKAELAETLSGDGPFTVFAPTDDAFEALLAELEVTLDDLSKEDLTPILLYHVLGLNARSEGLSSGMVNTLNTDAMLDVAVSADGVTLNGDVQVVVTDIQGKNGVIHVIDKVLVP